MDMVGMEPVRPGAETKSCGSSALGRGKLQLKFDLADQMPVQPSHHVREALRDYTTTRRSGKLYMPPHG
ncbi:hypothetical protein PV327_000692 [Microctonus hyperodae]|uniref:Uncharacterized protein n=2 Tax=Microctonus TaxID=144405 RepID=A0AA39G6P2_MICHY|nr:hypothetical protein PV328_003099 [Microctonus aethiopoides]KAK0182567.1 hypothetical protein PV327_000692 [Microctonus hyperodae]